jgi:peptide/nickel transport system substrate-binding protein
MGETLEAFSSGFDPHVLNAAYTALMGLFYQNLIRYHPKTLDLEPEIAQTWEQRSSTEFVFRLAPGVKWHNKPPLNGRELTAQDVVYSLERARTNDPKFINRALLGAIDRLEAVDRSTIRMTTKQPDVTALFGLADVSILIVAPEIFEKGDKLTTAEQAVGTGPYVLQAYQPDVGASLVRNPDYWKPGLPYLDGMKLVNIRDQQAGLAAFVAGQLDLTIVPGEEAKRFLGVQGLQYFVECA